MKRLKLLVAFFAASTLALSSAMCAIIAYSYCSLKYAALYEGASAPASTAFLYLVPFLPAIIICAVGGFVCHGRLVERKRKKWTGS